MEYKLCPVAEFKASEDKPGHFKALVAVYGNVDAGKDRILPGAFDDVLAKRQTFPLQYNHGWDIPPIGIAKAASTERGLEVDGQLLLKDDGISGQYARSVRSGMKAGALTDFSFAYEVAETKSSTVDGEDVRDIVKFADVFEVGPVLVGMNRDTQLIQAAGRDSNVLDELAQKLWDRMKSMLPTANDFALLDPDTSITSEEPQQLSPEEDERRAARFAEINRLKNLIPQR